RALPVDGEPPRASFHAGHVAGVERPVVRPPAQRRGPAALSLRNVTLRYPGAATPALCGVDLDVPAGALIGVTGPVGSGKSARTRAVLGLYPLESGAVLVDGRPVAMLSDFERTGLIGYLPQDPFLFSGSVRENVTFTARQGADDDPFLVEGI